MSKKINMLVSFSGGRTSAYMAWWLKEKMGHLYNFFFVFANTGAKHEKTLEFVNNCDLFLKLNLTWLEAKIVEGGGLRIMLLTLKLLLGKVNLLKK